jgi:hypothetical protein
MRCMQARCADQAAPLRRHCEAHLAAARIRAERYRAGLTRPRNFRNHAGHRLGQGTHEERMRAASDAMRRPIRRRRSDRAAQQAVEQVAAPANEPRIVWDAERGYRLATDGPLGENQKVQPVLRRRSRPGVKPGPMDAAAWEKYQAKLAAWRSQLCDAEALRDELRSQGWEAETCQLPERPIAPPVTGF